MFSQDNKLVLGWEGMTDVSRLLLRPPVPQPNTNTQVCKPPRKSPRNVSAQPAYPGPVFEDDHGLIEVRTVELALGYLVEIVTRQTAYADKSPKTDTGKEEGSMVGA